jgi:putative pyruvate formate lyase activating enzyme
MNQYTPLPHASGFPELCRRVTEAEYEEVVGYALELGIGHGFLQEGQTAEESFIPDFDLQLSENCCKNVEKK